MKPFGKQPAKISTDKWSMCSVCDEVKEDIIVIDSPDAYFEICHECAKSLEKYYKQENEKK